MKETGAHSVKMEGGEEVIESIRKIVSAGIPVMGHLGLTPQSIYKFGTYTVRAKEDEEAEKLRKDARLLQEAGCFAMVLEKKFLHRLQRKFRRASLFQLSALAPACIAMGKSW